MKLLYPAATQRNTVHDLSLKQLYLISLRVYTCRSVVETMLEAANWAPTHGKTEPWRFVVLGRAAQEELLDLSLKVNN